MPNPTKPAEQSAATVRQRMEDLEAAVPALQERIEELKAIVAARGDEREAQAYRIRDLEHEVDQLRRAHAAISDMARIWAGAEMFPAAEAGR